MIGRLLTDYAATIGRVFEGREHTVGASDVGQCARRVFWTKMEGDQPTAPPATSITSTVGAPAPAAPPSRTRSGCRRCASASAAPAYAGAEQRTLTSDLLSATPDGLLVKQPRNLLADLGVPDIGSSREVVVECKTIDPRARLDAAKLEHTFQVQIQLGLLHEVTKHRPEFAVISYTDASFWDETTEFVVVRDPKIYAHAKTRAQRIMLAKPRSSCRQRVGSPAAPSVVLPVYAACGRARTAVPGISDTVADPQFVAEMAELRAPPSGTSATATAPLTMARRFTERDPREAARQGAAPRRRRRLPASPGRP